MFDRHKLRCAVRMYYDTQHLRIANLQRTGNKKNRETGEVIKIDLTPEDQQYIDEMGKKYRSAEALALKEVDRQGNMCGEIYQWLIGHRGIGPTLAGFLLAEFKIEIAERPSQFWAYAGLACQNGEIQRLKKGQKAPFPVRVKSKVLNGLGECLIKANNEKYAEIYRNYRHRLESVRQPCQTCGGKGKDFVFSDKREEGTCWNCKGQGIGPWGKSDAHRFRAGVRYMVKIFLADFWRKWRELEGLPVVGTYCEDVLGHHHHKAVNE